jgi:Ca-activated chloride channel family protein
MSFALPIGLLALLAVPLVAGLSLLARRRRRRYAVRFPAAGTLVAAAGAPSRLRHLPLALLLCGLTLVALAIAKPQRTVAVAIERASILLVTDTSRSMLADDVAPSRLAAAQSAAKDFLDEVPDALQVGALSYSDRAALMQAPTTDRAAVAAAVDSLSANGGTATGDALDLAVKSLRSNGTASGPPSAIVLLSDGATTVGRDPVAVARAAATLKVPIYTVALGTGAGTVIGPNGMPVTVAPDPETLDAIARASGGRAFAVEDADGLSGVYRELGSKLGRRNEQREITAGVAVGGLLLLGGGLAGSLRRRPVLA